MSLTRRMWGSRAEREPFVGRRAPERSPGEEITPGEQLRRRRRKARAWDHRKGGAKRNPELV